MNEAAELWGSVLDEMELRLDKVAAAVQSDDPLPLPPFRTPVGLPPLPSECVERAQGIERRNRELVEAVNTLLDGHEGAPRHPVRTVEPARNPSRFDFMA